MHQHVTAQRIARRNHVNHSETPVRLLYENPSADYGWYYCFGVREAFAQTFCTDAYIEQQSAERGTEDTVIAIVGNFFDRAALLREQVSDHMCVYWMVVRIGVPRKNNAQTLMPAMAGIVMSRKTTLASMFDVLLQDPDDDESERSAYCQQSVAEFLPVSLGTRSEQVRADSLLHTVHTGLTIGYELATPHLIDKRLIKLS